MFCQQLLIYFVCCSQEASIDQAEVFHRVVSSLCVLLSKDEVTSLSRFDIEIEEGDKITITIFCVHI